MLSPWEPECHLQDMSVRRGPNNIASPLLLFCIWILGVPGFFRDCSLSFLTGPSKFRLAVVITAEYSVFFLRNPHLSFTGLFFEIGKFLTSSYSKQSVENIPGRSF